MGEWWKETNGYLHALAALPTKRGLKYPLCGLQTRSERCPILYGVNILISMGTAPNDVNTLFFLKPKLGK
jgi:hypothetical protein